MASILFCGDTLAQSSGLNYAALNICHYLMMAGHKVSYAVLQGSDSTQENFRMHDARYKTIFMYMQIYNCQLNNHLNFDKAIQKDNIDVVIALQDAWNIDQIINSKFRHQFTFINWCLFEVETYPEFVMSKSPYSKNVNKPIGEYYRNADMNIPVTQLARGGLEKFKAKIYKDNIPLGIHLEEREPRLSKTEVFGNAVNDNDFLFCSINRNSERKQIPILLDAFRLFLEAQKYPDKYKLYLHTNLAEQIGGTDLLTMINSLHLQYNILSPRCFIDGQQMSRKDIYKRISACDCYVTASGGEGFGYGCLEAMMHNLPVIFSDSGATKEFCKEGVAIKPTYYTYANNAFIKWNLVDAVDVANAMLKVANHGYVQKHYPLDYLDWKIIGDKFVNAIEDIISTTKKKNTIRMERII